MISITLGNGTEFGIDDNKELILRKVASSGQVLQEIKLGYASEKRLDMILLHIGSLRIHTDRS